MTQNEVIKATFGAVEAYSSSAEKVLMRWLATRRSDATRDTYARCLDAFGEFCRLGTADAVEALLSMSPSEAHSLMDAYVLSMKEAGKSGATRNKRIAALKSLVRYARTRGATTLILDTDNDRIEPVRDMAGPSPEDIEALFASARAGRDPVRDVALAHVLYSIGLRASEACSLDVGCEGVGKEGPILRATRKGYEQRKAVPIGGAALEAVRALATHRRAAGAAETDPLFMSQKKMRLTRQGANQIINRHAPSPTSAHRLRHAGATEYKNRGGNVQDVAAWLGHKGINLAQTYFDGKEESARRGVELLSKDRS